jgi:type I restriction enzyme S subunit
MRDDWLESRLGEIADINPEVTPKHWETHRPIRYVDIGSVKWGQEIPTDLEPMMFGAAPSRARRRIRAGDVLASTVRPNLRAFAVVPESLDGEVASTGFAVLRAKPDVCLPGFLWALVSHDAFSDAMVSKATGSNYPAVRPADVAGHPVWLPPPEEQRRIVDLLSTVDDCMKAASPWTARTAYDALLATFARGPRQTKLSEAISLRRPQVAVVPQGTYRVLGVRRSGEGFIDRGFIRGSDTGYAKLAVVGPNELVYRKLTAWEGPISVSTEAEVGGMLSPEFPVFKIDPEVLRPALLRHYCRWPGFWSRIENRLVGSVQRRKRLNPEELGQIRLPMPALSVQDTWVGALDSMWAIVQQRLSAEERLLDLRSNLLTALLSGAHEIPDTYDELLAG